MATKYVRKSYQHHSNPDKKRDTRKSPLSATDPKRRLLYIYIGLGVFATGLYVFHFKGLNSELGWRSPVDGPGVVIALILEDKEPNALQYFADIAVDLPASAGNDPRVRRLIDRVEITRENFESVRRGAALRVRYQAAYTGETIRIREILLPNPAALYKENVDTGPRVAPKPKIQ